MAGVASGLKLLERAKPKAFQAFRAFQAFQTDFLLLLVRHLLLAKVLPEIVRARILLKRYFVDSISAFESNTSASMEDRDVL